VAVILRLRRTGAKNDACFRVVATDRRCPRDGRFIEILGWYDPKRESNNFNLKLDRVEHWVSKGACLSNTVKSLVSKAKKLAAAGPELKPLPVPTAVTSSDSTDAEEQEQPSEETVASE
jgi:small subunit ribosomal protein S16